MTIITGARAGAIDVSGAAGGVSSKIPGETADTILVYGLPGVVLEPAVPTTSPDAVRARVLDDAGTFICHLPHAQGLRWMDEFNTAGAGSVDYRRYDDVETAHPTVWAPGNQIMISVGGIDIFRLVLDSEGGYRIDEAGNRIDTWAGMGALGVLNSGMCIPEYGWRPEATEERSFDYGSNPAIGGWLVASEWKTPVGRLVRSSWRWWYKKRHLPKGFPTKTAYWLWYRNPDSTSSADETCYFRSSFTLSQERRVKFWVCGDDTLEFQVDGEVRITTGRGGWKKTSTFVMHLSAGTHYVAAKVTNAVGSTGNQNRSGFLCAIGRLDGDGNVTKWLRRSNPDSWTVRRQRTTPPGWYAAQILRQLVSEQQSRGCAGHSPVTFGFSTTADSAGVGWVGRQERSITVGTLALDYTQQLVEAGIDVAMTPGLRLNAWRKRGADRSKYLRLDQGTARVLEESAAQLPAIRNATYARALSGWVGETSAASIAARGRRETMITLGSSRSSTQTAAALTAMLPDLAEPPQTIEVKLSGASGGPQPYKNFSIGDWVSYRPAGGTTWGRFRVMSVSGEVAEPGYPDWTIRLYED
jgi:hypothetical protein